MPCYQEWSRGNKAQGQEHKKKSEAKDRPSEGRPFRGQGHNAEVFSEKKVFAQKHRKVSAKLKQAQKKGLRSKNFQSFSKV